MSCRAWILCGALVAGAAIRSAGKDDSKEPSLTLAQAHETALLKHPRIRLADLRALAARQVTREARAAFFPYLSANLVAVGTAEDNTRLAAIASLNNPAIFERNAEGLVLSQLITDFGRTANLTSSARLRAQAEAEIAEATREQILLAVDAAFYAAAQAHSVSRVAEQTVATRQSFLEQVTALASNKLRSELDVSFARVNLEEGKLLLSRAQNDQESAFTKLTTVMGMREPRTYRLVEGPMPPDISTNADPYVEQALRVRPELLGMRHEVEAAFDYARAERAARFPTLSAVGSAGVVPVHGPELPDNYAAAGLVLNLPVFTGGLLSARQKEAELRTRALQNSLLDEENNVIRDVRIALLNAENAYERLRITQQLLDNASRAFALAEARYENGVSSIVELNQAQLNKISAEISEATTRYEYLLQRSLLNFQTGTLH